MLAGKLVRGGSSLPLRLALPREPDEYQIRAGSSHTIYGDCRTDRSGCL